MTRSGHSPFLPALFPDGSDATLPNPLHPAAAAGQRTSMMTTTMNHRAAAGLFLLPWPLFWPLPWRYSISFIPPSVKILRERLEGRGTDSAEVIEKRMSMAEKRIKEAEFYDYVIINDDLDRAVSEVKSIIESTRLERKNLCNFKEFVEKVLKDN